MKNPLEISVQKGYTGNYRGKSANDAFTMTHLHNPNTQRS